MPTLENIDYLAILLYLLLIAGVGLFFGWFIKDIRDYFKGGSAIPWQIGAVSNFMGLFSTFVFVAYAGVAYESGWVSVVVLWCTVLPGVFAALFMAKRWRRVDILTPVEYLEMRFNKLVRQLFSWAGLFMRFLDNIVRLYAMGIFLMTATPLDFFNSILISGMIITLFTIVGGVWAVTVIDNLQFIILVFVTIILVLLSLEAVEGLEGFAASYPDHFKIFDKPKGQPLWLWVYYLMIILKYNGNWVFIQRFFSVRDERASQRLGWLTALLFLLFPPLFMLPAILAVDIVPDLPNPEMAYVAVSMELLPPGLIGLMLAAMFSATMSSLNSEFNIMAGVLTNDIYKRWVRPAENDKHYITVARFSILLIGVLITTGSLFIGQVGGAFEANKLFTGIFAIPIAVPLIFGLLLKRPDPFSAISTVVIGMLSGIVFNFVFQLSWELATLSEMVICIATFVWVRYTRHPSESYLFRVNHLFEKIKMPLSQQQKPHLDRKLSRALARLFALTIFLSGLLFLVMGAPSMNLNSGLYAVIGGALCLILGAVIYGVYGRNNIV